MIINLNPRGFLSDSRECSFLSLLSLGLMGNHLECSTYSMSGVQWMLVLFFPSVNPTEGRHCIMPLLNTQKHPDKFRNRAVQAPF